MELTEEQIQDFTNRMREAAQNEDREIAHPDMDEILLEIAEAVGCVELVEIFNKAEKWYS